MLDHGALPYTYSSHLLNDKQICLSTMMRVKVLKPCSHMSQMNDTFHKRETKSATQQTSRRGHVALALTLGREIFVDWAHLKNTCYL